MPIFHESLSGPRGSLGVVISFEGVVPDLRTMRAERPMPSASDPSTGSGRVWTVIALRRRPAKVPAPRGRDHAAAVARRVAGRGAGRGVRAPDRRLRRAAARGGAG